MFSYVCTIEEKGRQAEKGEADVRENRFLKQDQPNPRAEAPDLPTDQRYHRQLEQKTRCGLTLNHVLLFIAVQRDNR